MRKDICFVCIGQCAGNIGILLEKKGYSVLFLNTASVDMRFVRNSAHTYKIPGADGCNQDPEKAQQIFAQSAEVIMQKVITFAKKRITYFICSSSGGTGGGMTPLILEYYLEQLAEEEERAWDEYNNAIDNGEEDVKQPEKRKAGLITVLPAIDESPAFNANSYNFMKQVCEILDKELQNEYTNLASFLLIDNENTKDVMELNKKFVNLLDKVLKIPEQHFSVKGNVDNADLENAFTEPGVLVMSELLSADCSAGSLIRAIRNSDVFAQTEEASCVYWVSSTTEEIETSEIESELGVPKAHYQTFNENCNLFLVSGLDVPGERISLLADRATEFKVHERKSHDNLFKKDVKISTTARRPSRVVSTEQAAEPSVKEKLNKLRRRRG